MTLALFFHASKMPSLPLYDHRTWSTQSVHVPRSDRMLPRGYRSIAPGGWCWPDPGADIGDDSRGSQALPKEPLGRRLVMQSGQYTLGPFGKDSELRRFGLELAVRGGVRGRRATRDPRDGLLSRPSCVHRTRDRTRASCSGTRPGRPSCRSKHGRDRNQSRAVHIRGPHSSMTTTRDSGNLGSSASLPWRNPGGCSRTTW